MFIISLTCQKQIQVFTSHNLNIVYHPLSFQMRMIETYVEAQLEGMEILWKITEPESEYDGISGKCEAAMNELMEGLKDIEE